MVRISHNFGNILHSLQLLKIKDNKKISRISKEEITKEMFDALKDEKTIPILRINSTAVFDENTFEITHQKQDEE